MVLGTPITCTPAPSAFTPVKRYSAKMAAFVFESSPPTTTMASRLWSTGLLDRSELFVLLDLRAVGPEKIETTLLRICSTA